jgi:transposase
MTSEFQKEASKLPDNIEACHEEIRRLKAQLDWFRRQVFAPRSDRLPGQEPAHVPGQPDLFVPEEADQEPGQETGAEEPGQQEAQPAQAQAQPPEAEADPRQRARRGHGRRNLKDIEDLPVHERVVHDVPEEDKNCGCGLHMRELPPKVSRQLHWIPAQVYVVEHVCRQYGCDCANASYTAAHKPMEVIEKSLASPSLLAQVAVAKYCDHVPLHRQEVIFKRHGIDLARSTMCDWMAQTAKVLEPLTGLMARRQRESDHLHVDETTMPVQAAGQTKRAYLWAVVGGPEAPYEVYHFHDSRGRAGPEEFLKGFTGTLQSDAYQVYKSLGQKNGWKHAGCWAHCRRKFVDAFKTTSSANAHKAVQKIGILYQVERDSAGMDDAQRLAMRQQHARPAAEEFFAWLKDIQISTLPQSAVGKAIAYALDNQAELSLYLEDPQVAIDNNAVERALRPVVIGRKNWLFAGSHNGGKTAATIFTVIQSAKRHGLNVYQYIKDILTRIPAHPRASYHELLPDHWKPLTH